MDLVFLGPSAGVPTRRRNVTALALQPESGRNWYLVDCGEATQHRLLHLPMTVMGLRAIFITHVHGDHSYGLPGLLACAAMSGRSEPLTLVAPAAVIEWVAATRSLTELYLPFRLQSLALESFEGWQDDEFAVEAVPVSHSVPTFAYRFSEVKRAIRLDTDRLVREGIPRGPLWGALKAGEDVVFGGRTLASRDYLVYPDLTRRIVVGGDNDSPELLSGLCEGAQVLVHEATYTREVAARMGPEIQHSSAAAIASFAEEQNLANLLLTHFSPRYQDRLGKGLSVADIEAEARAHYQGRLFLAEDFARYRLDREGILARVSGAEPSP